MMDSLLLIVLALAAFIVGAVMLARERHGLFRPYDPTATYEVAAPERPRATFDSSFSTVVR